MFQENDKSYGISYTLSEPMKISVGKPMITNDAWIANLKITPKDKNMEKEKNYKDEAKILLDQYKNSLELYEKNLEKFMYGNSYVFDKIAEYNQEIRVLKAKIGQLRIKLEEDGKEEE